MKLINYFIFLAWFWAYTQTTVSVNFIKKDPLIVDNIVAIDNFETYYFVNDNVFNKKNISQILSYNNLQLGHLNAINAFNPLKINLFYKDFNTAIILDNRLAEIFRIDFNMLQPYKNVSHLSTGFDNTLWIFNQDTQQLELYDYKSNMTRVKTLPIQGTVLDIKSSYNYCWLLTEKYIYTYNYFGSLLKKLKNDGFTKMAENNENLILNKDNHLFYLKKDTEIPVSISLPNLLINQFFVTNETLYIYDLEYLHQFKLKTN